MKFPSISHVLTQLQKSFIRFYLPIMIAIIGSAFTIVAIESHNEPAVETIKTIYTCLLGVPLAIGCFLFAERRGMAHGKILMGLLAIAMLVLYWLFLAPEKPFQDYYTTLIFFVLALVCNLWVAIAAYINKDERLGFWRFNEALFARMIMSVLFSIVIFVGLALAVASLEQLFNFNIMDDFYGEVWVVVAGIFNTWFFLSGVPDDYHSIDKAAPFPKGLKIFAQYILIPLATIYMVILYAYSIKILIEWQLPKGWVSMLVISYSVVGILATLLAYPLRQDTDNAWVRLFSRFFYVGLVPLILLLFVAIEARINDYGITELRYYLILISIWLAVMAIYNIVSKQHNIKLIPVTLAIAGLISLVGPWSVFSMSHNSQQNRLEGYLEQYGIWSTGTELNQPSEKLTTKDAEEIHSILDYFVERRQTDKLQYIFSTDLQEVEKAVFENCKEKYDYINNTSSYYDFWQVRHDMIDTMCAMLYIAKPSDLNQLDKGAYNVKQSSIDIKGYSVFYSYHYDCYSEQLKRQVITLPDNDSVVIEFINEKEEVSMNLTRDGESISLKLLPLIDELKGGDQYDYLSANEMSITDSSNRYKLIIQRMYTDIDKQSKKTNRIDDLQGYLLIQ